MPNRNDRQVPADMAAPSDRQREIVAKALGDAKRAGIRVAEGYANMILGRVKAILMVGTGREWRRMARQRSDEDGSAQNIYAPETIATVIAWHYYRTEKRKRALTVRIFDKRRLGFQQEKTNLDAKTQADRIRWHLATLLPEGIGAQDVAEFELAEQEDVREYRYLGRHYIESAIVENALESAREVNVLNFADALRRCLPEAASRAAKENLSHYRDEPLEEDLEYSAFELWEIARAYAKGYRVKIGYEREHVYDSVVTNLVLGRFGESGMRLWEKISGGKAMREMPEDLRNTPVRTVRAPHPDTGKTMEIPMIKAARNHCVTENLKTKDLRQVENEYGSVLGHVYWDDEAIRNVMVRIRHEFRSTPFHPNERPKAGNISRQDLMDRTEKYMSQNDLPAMVGSCVANVVSAVRRALVRDDERGKILYWRAHAIANKIRSEAGLREVDINNLLVDNPQFVAAVIEYSGKDMEYAAHMICDLFRSDDDVRRRP